MADNAFNTWPSWLQPGGAGFEGTLFALAPAAYQANPDFTVLFLNGRVIGVPKITFSTNTKTLLDDFILPLVDASTRNSESLLTAFIESVKFGFAVPLSPDTPRPVVDTTPEVGPSRKMIGLFMSQAQFDQWYASHPNAVHPD